MPHFSSPGHQQQQQKQLNHHQEADRDLPPPPPEPDISSSGAAPLPPTEKVVGLLNRAANVSAMQLIFSLVLRSVADPDPEGSETFDRIRIRSGTEINVSDPHLDPDSNSKLLFRIRNTGFTAALLPISYPLLVFFWL